VLHARGAIVLFADADLSSPIEEAPKLLQALEAGADIAIGSRWLRSELQTQRQSLTRQVLEQLQSIATTPTPVGIQGHPMRLNAFRRGAAKA
jgi:hypothetical protein